MLKYELENILTLTKSLINLYINANVEASNKEVLKFTFNQLKTTLELKEKLFEAMQEDGFYNVSCIDTKTIKSTYKKLKDSL